MKINLSRGCLILNFHRMSDHSSLSFASKRAEPTSAQMLNV